ncbi:GntR family transcriptional regulator [Izhakiella australiensis]|uniref:GntR family transcriptional regulator n=1 Tax=Izhakiella australiensis TaxID=1926881 RepID=A0A1S8YL98_9GAMM|nr:GntR family transcriptional regulator [Izhakiella australiensis]OON39668.1 GntR family transcriptional regulator [Izhakiella australiensis]
MGQEPQLRQTNLRDQALSILKLRLVSGDLAPGQIYSASALAEELGVSNSPVREAMLTLVNQGLMEAVRNRGFRVLPLSDKERHNIYELRMLLEVPSMAKLAGMKEKIITRKAEFAAIAANMVNFAREGDIVGYLEMDRQFHLGLLAILENEQLVTIVENLRDQSRQYGLKALRETGGLIKSAEEHQPILEAMAAGDETLTASLMTAHLTHLVGDWAG